MDQAEILRQYKAARALSNSLGERVVKMLSREDLQAAARELGMLRGKIIYFETEDESSVLMDYAVHNVFRDGRNAIDRLLAENPPTDEQELQMLHSMRQAYFTIFQVQTPIPGLGVRGIDGIEKEPKLLVDIGFGSTAISGLAMATRIYSPAEGWWMTTGASLPLNPKALDLIIRDHEAHVRRFGRDPTDEERATHVIRACIATGAANQVAYADPGELMSRNSTPVVRGSPKIGRNDACPCGSGKKYKKCCGA